ncbi:MAG: DUF2586 family protein [Bacteroidetes bacterium]|nr:DUF2586 family protein [Bacteroidota bacterium]
MSGLPGIDITIKNGLGRVNETADAVAGMVVSGVVTTGYLTLGEAVRLFSFQAFLDLGFIAANNAIAYSDVKAFYDMAGEGAELWLMVVSDATLLTALCDKDTVGISAKKLLDAAAGRIRILSINRKAPVGYVSLYATGLGGVDDDCFAAITKLEALRLVYAAAYKPFRAIICGQGFRTTTIGALDLKTMVNKGVQVALGSSAAGVVLCGLLLGRYAAIPVQRNPARVKDGNIGISAACFPDGVAVNAVEASWNAIHDKGYLFIRNYYGKAGFFFTDDPTCTANANDYCSFARGRVIDKALCIAYTTLIEELNDDIEVDQDNGYISAGIIASWKSNVENALQQNMTGEISGSPECYINPKQNFLSADKVAVSINIVPKGYSKKIDITLGLVNPFKTA